MGLFSKKSPCPICGGKISWILPAKIEEEHVCSDCYGKIDMDPEKSENLTMEVFRKYLEFYDQNQPLKDKFVVSERVDFGLWDTKIIFDYENKLFCMSKSPDKTVFEGSRLKALVIKEDNTPLFEVSAEGILRHSSSVPERALAMSPHISQFMTTKQMAQRIYRMNQDKNKGSAPMHYFNMPEPFQAFNVELHLDHPYWPVIKCDMDAPKFDNQNPDINNYIRDYNNSIAEIEKLVTAFKTVAFPGAKESVNQNNVASVDAIEEIKKYKSLMEEGIISQEEFNAKKRQLLGI